MDGADLRSFVTVDSVGGCFGDFDFREVREMDVGGRRRSCVAIKGVRYGSCYAV